MQAELFAALIGKTPAQAEAWLSENTTEVNKGTPVTLVRTTVRDGKPMIGTMDYRVDRLNVATQDGKITNVRGVG